VTRLAWDAVGTRLYEAGVDRGVLYIDAAPGVPWSGLISVSENPTGGEQKAYYQDGEMYQSVSSRERFAATISAYTYPDEFARCDGTAQIRNGLFLTGQPRKRFSMSYRTKIGNDTAGIDFAYKIHIIYNAQVAPTQINRATLKDDTEANEFSWPVTALAPAMSGYLRTAHIIIDSRSTNPITLANLENILYGGDSTSARLPTFTELVAVFDTLVELEVVDNGDGTYTISGPDESVYSIDTGVFTVDWPTVTEVEDTIYNVSS
jgi:hypothetical protein